MWPPASSAGPTEPPVPGLIDHGSADDAEVVPPEGGPPGNFRLVESDKV